MINAEILPVGVKEGFYAAETSIGTIFLERDAAGYWTIRCQGYLSRGMGNPQLFWVPDEARAILRHFGYGGGNKNLWAEVAKAVLALILKPSICEPPKPPRLRFPLRVPKCLMGRRIDPRDCDDFGCKYHYPCIKRLEAMLDG